MSNHTEEAVKAAEKVLLKYDSNSGTTIESRNDWDVAVDGAAAIIDRETNLPELKRQLGEMREVVQFFMTVLHRGLLQVNPSRDSEVALKTMGFAQQLQKAHNALATAPPKSEGEGKVKL